MTKRKHPSNRRERLYIKKIKDDKDNSGGIRKRTADERLSNELGQFEILEATSEEESMA